LNGILSANLETFVLLIMLTQLIATASFAGILGAYGVEKIFFCVIGLVPYLYLFLTVGGSFDLRFGFVSDHTLAFVIMLAGGAWLLFLVGRRLWPRVVKLAGAGQGRRQVLGQPRKYLLLRRAPVPGRVVCRHRRDGDLSPRL
jgi:hypothetical protein